MLEEELLEEKMILAPRIDCLSEDFYRRYTAWAIKHFGSVVPQAFAAVSQNNIERLPNNLSEAFYPRIETLSELLRMQPFREYA